MHPLIVLLGKGISNMPPERVASVIWREFVEKKACRELCRPFPLNGQVSLLTSSLREQLQERQQEQRGEEKPNADPVVFHSSVSKQRPARPVPGE